MKHLDEVGETYGEHFKCAAKFGCVLFGLSIVCIIHALIPYILTTTTSKRLEKLIEEMRRCDD